MKFSIASPFSLFAGPEVSFEYPSPLYTSTGTAPGTSRVRINLPVLYPEQQVLHPNFLLEHREAGGAWQREVFSVAEPFWDLSLQDGAYEIRLTALGAVDQQLVGVPYQIFVQGTGKCNRKLGIAFIMWPAICETVHPRKFYFLDIT